MSDPEVSKIQQHMPVLGFDGVQVGTVDHMDGQHAVKLSKDEQGQHHWIPTTWIKGVDQVVHLDRPGNEAKQSWFTSQPTEDQVLATGQ